MEVVPPMKKLFIISFAILMVCSVSVLAVSSTVTSSALSVTLGMNGNSRTVTSVNSLQTLDFNANITGYSDFEFDISVPSQNLDSAMVVLRGKFQVNTGNWRYFEPGEITLFGAQYHSGTHVNFAGAGNSTLKWSSSGTTWWCDFSCTASFADIRNISQFYISMDLDDLRNVDVIISTMLSWFTVEFDVTASAQHEADREADEQHAQQSGDGNIDDLTGSIDTGNADQAGSAIQNFANAFVTNDTSAVLQVPGFGLPDFLGGHTLFEGASVDFEDTIEQFPSTILLVVRSLFTVFLIVFAVKETYNLVTQFLTTGKVGGDK